MSGAIPSLPQYAFMAWYSVERKHRDNFTFTVPYHNTTLRHNPEHFDLNIHRRVNESYVTVRYDTRLPTLWTLYMGR
jgi:hypothetical protein